MARLEELTRGAAVKGVLPDGLVTVVDAKWYGSSVVELTYKDASGRPGSELLDPLLAVHTSVVDPLPHQITAVYEEMLTRQPLRFLLADDPGAGKTIMAGLFIKELLIRGDLRRCLIVCPGNLTEQWQDELYRRFDLDFTLITRETVESSRSGNPFAEHNLAIARLDHLARNEEVQARLAQTDWDLTVCDEA